MLVGPCDAGSHHSKVLWIIVCKAVAVLVENAVTEESLGVAVQKMAVAYTQICRLKEFHERF